MIVLAAPVSRQTDFICYAGCGMAPRFGAGLRLDWVRRSTSPCRRALRCYAHFAATASCGSSWPDPCGLQSSLGQAGEIMSAVSGRQIALRYSSPSLVTAPIPRHADLDHAGRVSIAFCSSLSGAGICDPDCRGGRRSEFKSQPWRRAPPRHASIPILLLATSERGIATGPGMVVPSERDTSGGISRSSGTRLQIAHSDIPGGSDAAFPDKAFWTPSRFLTGKTALVTGSTSGIETGIAQNTTSRGRKYRVEPDSGTCPERRVATSV